MLDEKDKDGKPVDEKFVFSMGVCVKNDSVPKSDKYVSQLDNDERYSWIYLPLDKECVVSDDMDLKAQQESFNSEASKVLKELMKLNAEFNKT